MTAPPSRRCLIAAAAVCAAVTPIGETTMEGWPFIVMLLLLLAVTLFPHFVLWLQRTMGLAVK